MKRHYREYTDKDIVNGVEEVNSLAELLRKLGLRPAGGNYINIKRKLQELKLDCAHWKCRGWNKGQQLKDWSSYTKVTHLKIHLIEKRGRRCEKCKLEKWLEIAIPLEVHHCDGDRTNNEYNNLQLLCPNCHSTTPFYRNRKLSAPIEK